MLIGLHGKARTGKDTIAKHLEHEHWFTICAFADHIRNMLRIGLGLPREVFSDGRKDEIIPHLGKSPRQLMQTLGTEWGRDLVHPDIWVMRTEQEIISHQRVTNDIVISDVRIENEAAMIRRLGGIIIHLSRGEAQPVSTHSSEGGIVLGDYDVPMTNDGTIEELHAKIDAFVAYHQLREARRG